MQKGLKAMYAPKLECNVILEFSKHFKIHVGVIPLFNLQIWNCKKKKKS